MNDKEKIMVGFLGLVVSIGIFILIVIKATDFSQITVKSKSDEILKYLYDMQYEKFYDEFSNNNELYKSDQLIEYQENIEKLLGNIEKYKYVLVTKSEKNKENIMSVDYDVNFSEFPNETIRMKVLFIKNDTNWNAIGYKIMTDKVNNSSQLIDNINYINLNSNIEEKQKINEAKNKANQIMQFYQKKDYKDIYLIAGNELKEKGTEDEFVQYLKNKENDYGNVNNTNLAGYEVSRDKSEYKFNYFIDDNKKKSIIIWVNINQNSYLSGINFN